MTNQEQYELICEKAEKYDRLVGMLDKIRAEIEEEIVREYIPYTGGYMRSTLDADKVLGIIDKYKKESEMQDADNN